MVKRCCGLALLGCMFVSTSWAAPVPSDTVPDRIVRDRTELLPYRKFQVLGGKVVGVLVADVIKVMAADGRAGPSDAYAFSRDAQSYRWVYVIDTEKPIITNLRVEVGEKTDSDRVTYPKLGMANAKHVERWGVKTKYTLVEVEVNDGKGSPATEGFVATHMAVLDGTKGYPIEVEKAFADAKKRYADYLVAEKKTLDAALAVAQKAAIGNEKPNQTITSDDILVLTWMSETNRLRVAFVTRTSSGKLERVKIPSGRRDPFPLPPGLFPPGLPGGCDDAQAVPPPAPMAPPAAAPIAPPPPFEIEVTTGSEFWIDFGRAYEYSKEGRLVGTLTLAATAGKTVHKAPPPPPVEGDGPRPMPLPVKKP